jgi:hypothetical protein
MNVKGKYVKKEYRPVDILHKYLHCVLFEI